MRHGLVANPQQIIYGSLPNFHLSEDGQKEVHKRALVLTSYPYTKIICSPLDRTRETAKIVQEIAFPNIKIETDERLIEWTFASQGLTRKEWQEKYPKLRVLYKRDVYSLPKVVDGKEYETFQSMEDRLRSFINEKKQEEGLVLAISHGDPITLAMSIVSNADYRHYRDNDYVSTAEVRTVNFLPDKTVVTEYPL